MTSSVHIDHVETTRLVCERLRMDHLDEVSRLLRDPRVSATLWLGREPPTEDEVITSLTDKMEHWRRFGFGLWLVRDRASGEMVGRGGLQWTYALDLNQVEAAWAIVPERWSQGFATELALAAIEVAFGPLALESIIAFTLPGNVGSRRVMKKTGFVYERDIVHASLPHVLYRRWPGEPETRWPGEPETRRPGEPEARPE